ncbi:hypothetical protein QJS66_11060 [Kocuria rhizophila]|nr:hypothetical protein QJS66_11060 [Kocuria rhizophila]
MVTTDMPFPAVHADHADLAGNGVAPSWCRPAAAGPRATPAPTSSRPWTRPPTSPRGVLRLTPRPSPPLHEPAGRQPGTPTCRRGGAADRTASAPSWTRRNAVSWPVTSSRRRRT